MKLVVACIQPHKFNDVKQELSDVTAPCAYIEPWAALIIGAVGGILVVLGVIFLDKLKIDDPVGAVPVHGFNGIWGILSVGLFGRESLGLSHDGLSRRS